MSSGRFLASTVILAFLVGLFFVNAADAHESASPPAGKATTPAQSAEFRDASLAVDAFRAALSNGDDAAALALLADDIQIFEQGEVERSKMEYASHHLPSDIEFSRATQSTQTARMGAAVDDIAYVISEGKIAGRYKDKAVNLITIETMVLRRHSNGWRIVHIHWSSRRTDPAPPKQ